MNRTTVRRIVEITLSLVPVVCLWLLCGEIVGSGWFAGDDTLSLRRTLEHGPIALFFDPLAWRQFSTAFVMPWISASFAVDYLLFGLEPMGYFAHQLISLSLALGLLFAWLRNYLSRPSACLAACAFAVSLPTTSIAIQLMTRHYAEGLCFSLLALLMVEGIRNDDEEITPRGKMLVAAAACCYLLASLSKEIFVPLPLVVVTLPGLSRSKRVFLTLTFGAAAVLYVAWRIHLLGLHNALVSYGGDVQRSLHTFFAWAQAIPAALGWTGFGCALLVVLAVVVAASRIPRSVSRGHWVVLLAAAIFAGAPLLGVFPGLAPRFFFMPVLFGAVLLAAGLERGLAKRRGGWMAIVLFLLIWTFTASTASRRMVAERVHRSADSARVGNFLLGAESAGLGVFVTGESGGYFSHLLWLREHASPRGDEPPRICAHACVCADPQLSWVELTVDGPRKIEFSADQCLRSDEIETELLYDPAKGRLRWRFGPWTEGQYFIARSVWDFPNTGHFVPLPPTGEVPIHLHKPVELVVRYRDPHGRDQFSPGILLDPDKLPGFPDG